MAKNTIIALLVLLCGFSFWNGNESVVIGVRHSNYVVQIATHNRLTLHYPFLIVKSLNGIVNYSQELPGGGEDYSWDLFKNIRSISSDNRGVVVLLEPKGLYAGPDYRDFIESKITLPDGMLLRFEVATEQ
ncbi:hypothetical protein [Rheinheimera sp. MM224]|uniref:hypothetical protein n=1 Tax=Rheinheimera sp. MM224 TaxID=3019969 RepID=UPI0021F863AD|nr:hypothetical protein [Rheinheimera sp. MM224]CAI3791921.1 hypothetical protein JAMGFMIE_00429 [Rheinheimera sp. MM224]